MFLDCPPLPPASEQFNVVDVVLASIHISTYGPVFRGVVYTIRSYVGRMVRKRNEKSGMLLIQSKQTAGTSAAQSCKGYLYHRSHPPTP